MWVQQQVATGDASALGAVEVRAGHHVLGDGGGGPILVDLIDAAMRIAINR
jgi:hypothetical protein